MSAQIDALTTKVTTLTAAVSSAVAASGSLQTVALALKQALTDTQALLGSASALSPEEITALSVSLAAIDEATSTIIAETQKMANTATLASPSN